MAAFRHGGLSACNMHVTWIKRHEDIDNNGNNTTCRVIRRECGRKRGGVWSSQINKVSSSDHWRLEGGGFIHAFPARQLIQLTHVRHSQWSESRHSWGASVATQHVGATSEQCFRRFRFLDSALKIWRAFANVYLKQCPRDCAFVLPAIKLSSAAAAVHRRTTGRSSSPCRAATRTAKEKRSRRVSILVPYEGAMSPPERAKESFDTPYYSFKRLAACFYLPSAYKIKNSLAFIKWLHVVGFDPFPRLARPQRVNDTLSTPQYSFNMTLYVFTYSQPTKDKTPWRLSNWLHVVAFDPFTTLKKSHRVKDTLKTPRYSRHITLYVFTYGQPTKDKTPWRSSKWLHVVAFDPFTTLKKSHRVKDTLKTPRYSRHTSSYVFTYQ